LPARIKLFFVFLTVFIAAPFVASSNLYGKSGSSKIPMLTIGIRTRREKVHIWGTKGFRVKDPATNRNLFARKKSTKLLITVHMKGFMIDGFGVKSKVTIEPLKGSLLYVDGKPYRGSFIIDEDRFGKITVINHIDVEKYLYGVIKSEMLINSPMEALKAQAVIARTFAIKYKDKFLKSRGYGLTDDTSSQVYIGVTGEDPRGTKAVDNTKGLCLTSYNKLIQCYYHAACGGWTLNNEDAWGGTARPYLRGIKCGYCTESYGHDWDLTLSYTTILEKLLEQGKRLGRITSIRSIRDDESQRAIVLVIENQKGQLRILGNLFRLAIGPTVLRSSFFNIEENDNQLTVPTEDWQSNIGKLDGNPDDKSDDNQSENHLLDRTKAQQSDLKMEAMIGNYLENINEPDQLKIHGAGSGHGVGLCQSGARGQAKLDRTFKQILEFYYVNTKVKSFY